MQLPFVSGALFARLVRIASFEGFIPPPFILISPVMTAALPSPSFRAGWVHRDERSVGRWID